MKEVMRLMEGGVKNDMVKVHETWQMPTLPSNWILSTFNIQSFGYRRRVYDLCEKSPSGCVDPRQ